MDRTDGLDTETLQRYDNQYIHPWDLLQKADANQRTVINRGDGIYVTDSDGNRLIDAPAGMWCVNIGHGRREMAEAIADQALAMPYNSPWSLTNAPSAVLAQKAGRVVAGRPEPGVLHHRRLDRGRFGAALRDVHEQLHGPAGEEAHHFAGQGLSRQHLSGRVLFGQGARQVASSTSRLAGSSTTCADVNPAATAATARP